MKKALAILLTACMLFSFCACGTATSSTSAPAASGTNAPAAPNSGAPAATKVIKLASGQADSHILTRGLAKFKELVEAKSGGALAVEIYSTGVLGPDSEVVQQVRLGSTDGIITGVLQLQGEYPQVAIDEMPFLYQSDKHVYAAYDGELGKLMQSQVFDPSGLVCLGTWGCGFRHYTNNLRPIVHIEDVKGIKFRTAESAIRISMFKAIGAEPVVMAQSELFTALQQNTVDGQENPLSTILASSYNEVQKYLSLSGHIYTTGFFFVNKAMYDSLTDQERAWVDEAAAEATAWERETNASEDADYLQALKDAGMQVNEIERDEFVKAVAPVWDEYKAKFGSEWIDLVQKVAP